MKKKGEVGKERDGRALRCSPTLMPKEKTSKKKALLEEGNSRISKEGSP